MGMFVCRDSGNKEMKKFWMEQKVSRLEAIVVFVMFGIVFWTSNIYLGSFAVVLSFMLLFGFFRK